MPSKKVLDREKSSRAVIAAAESHAGEIAEGISREFAPYLKKGETMPDIELLAALAARRLKQEIEALVSADRAHEAELSDDTAPREARDEAADKVRVILVDLRDAISTAYGTAGLKVLGLVGAVPFDPSAIKSLAEAVHTALSAGGAALPKARQKSVKVDLKGFAADLAIELPALTKALENVAREEREAKTTLGAKSAAMASHDRAFSRTAGLVSALAMSGELENIATTVRPSARRSGRTAAEEEEQESGASEEQTGDASE
jgi:hypothetical protein